MARRKKRNTLTLVSLLLALAALVGFYLWYTKRETEPVGEDSSIPLSTVKTADITSLHYVYGDTDMTFTRDGENWILEGEPDRPLNQSRVTSLLSVIDEISATRLIAETRDNLADFGLEQPASYIQAILGDGSAVTLQIGNQPPSGDGYYALVNEDNKVYLLAASYGSGLKYTNSDFTAVVDGPEVTAANIRYIKIDLREGQDFELSYQEGQEGNGAGSSMFPWVILKPYPQPYTADSSAVSTLQENYKAFDYSECVEYSAKDLAVYGLEDPLAVIELGYLEERTETLEKPEKNPDTGEEITEKTYYDEKEFKLLIGDQTESGSYYVMPEGDTTVYTMTKSTVDKMITVDAFSLLNKFIAIPLIDTVDRIEAEIDGTVYTLSMERSAVKNEKDEEEVQTTYFYNGKEAEEAAFKDIYQSLISAKYDAENKEEMDAGSAKPRLTISFYLNDTANTVITASYLPYNDSFYLVQNGSETRFFADKRSIDQIAEAVAGFQVKEK